jgi:hypothetical protein
MDFSKIKDQDKTWEDKYEFDKNEGLITSPGEIVDFLDRTYLLQNGDNMIKGITIPVNGKIQVWYLKQQRNHTESLIDKLKVGLARHMTTKCIQETFKNPREIKNQI